MQMVTCDSIFEYFVKLVCDLHKYEKKPILNSSLQKICFLHSTCTLQKQMMFSRIKMVEKRWKLW